MSVLDELRIRPAWQRDALCREHPRVNFAPQRGEDVRPALRICAGCLVRDECLAHALELGDFALGVWGGTSARQRAVMLRRRRQAAAAQHAAQESPLRARRRAAGYTQGDVARALGVTQEAVSAWERGATTPRPELAAHLEELLCRPE